MHFTSQVSCLEMLGTSPVVGITLEIPMYISYGGYTLCCGYTHGTMKPHFTVTW